MKAEVHGTILLKRRISLCPRVFVSQPSWRIKSLATHGTVRSTIPGVRESLYIHQQDGFEFLWKTLAGTTDVSELKSTKRKDVGGCIISHAPGTGKIRLSIVFVQSYLRMYPNSRPVIIAPANILFT